MGTQEFIYSPVMQGLVEVDVVEGGHLQIPWTAEQMAGVSRSSGRMKELLFIDAEMISPILLTQDTSSGMGNGVERGPILLVFVRGTNVTGTVSHTYLTISLPLPLPQPLPLPFTSVSVSLFCQLFSLKCFDYVLFNHSDYLQLQ